MSAKRHVLCELFVFPTHPRYAARRNVKTETTFRNNENALIQKTFIGKCIRFWSDTYVFRVHTNNTVLKRNDYRRLLKNVNYNWLMRLRNKSGHPQWKERYFTFLIVELRQDVRIHAPEVTRRMECHWPAADDMTENAFALLCLFFTDARGGHTASCHWSNSTMLLSKILLIFNNWTRRRRQRWDDNFLLWWDVNWSP